nr:hypothetical protein CFP56_38894 [Quercus suber]
MVSDAHVGIDEICSCNHEIWRAEGVGQGGVKQRAVMGRYVQSWSKPCDVGGTEVDGGEDRLDGRPRWAWSEGVEMRWQPMKNERRAKIAPGSDSGRCKQMRRWCLPAIASKP